MLLSIHFWFHFRSKPTHCGSAKDIKIFLFQPIRFKHITFPTNPVPNKVNDSWTVVFFAELIFFFPVRPDKRGSFNRPKHRYNLNRNKTSKVNRSQSRREQIARLKTFSGGMLRAIGNTVDLNFETKKVNWYCFCHSAPLHLGLISQSPKTRHLLLHHL